MAPHKAELVVYHDPSPYVLAQFDDSICLLEALHKGLLAEDMAACLESHARYLEMRCGWSGNSDDVRLDAGQHFLRRCEYRERPGAGGHNLYAGHDSQVGELSVGRQVNPPSSGS